MQGSESDIEKSFGGFLFFLIIVLAVVTGVAQLVIAKHYAITGFVITLIAGLVTAFLAKAAHSPRAKSFFDKVREFFGS